MSSQRLEILNRRRKLRQTLREITLSPIMRGSIVAVQRRCGNPACACAKDPDARHPGKYLSVNINGRTETLHLRAADEDKVRKATEAYTRLWDVVTELTICELAEMRRLARDRKRARQRKSK